MAHLAAHVVEELGRLDFLGVRTGGVLVCTVPCHPCYWECLAALAYVARVFGPDTLPTIQEQLISTAGRFFSRNVVNEIIAPTVRDIVKGARGEVVSVGFVISLWAGSSAISAFRRFDHRGPRSDGAASPRAPTVLRAGPVCGDAPRGDRDGAVPRTWAAQDRRVSSRTAGTACWPTATTLSCFLALVVAMKRPLPGVADLNRCRRTGFSSARCWRPWWFLGSPRSGLRVYLTWITSTGYTYGALATRSRSC